MTFDTSASVYLFKYSIYKLVFKHEEKATIFYFHFALLQGEEKKKRVVNMIIVQYI